jgi:tRNA pseudouridine55 synthase
MDGILLVNKPAGISSFAVVAKVRGIWRAQLREAGESIKRAKVGHTGTLDPAATGLMILVLGSYTKKAEQFSKLDKVYEVSACLGAVSTTGDREGEITKTGTKQPTLAAINAVLAKFEGQIQQTPPAYSAIKLGGVRAYKLARAGKEVVLEPRTVHIHSIRSIDYNYPKLTFTAHVGSGTYIRSLVEDIGQALATGAYMTELSRAKVGKYSLEEAINLDNLEYSDIIKAIERFSSE